MAVRVILTCVTVLSISFCSYAEFQVNTYTTNDQRYQAVDSDGAGNFVVVWYDNSQDEIYGQRFNTNGEKTGGQFKVGDGQYYVDVAMNSNGRFIAAWGNDELVYAKIYDSNGTVLTDNFQVNTIMNGLRIGLSVDIRDNENSVITWGSSQATPGYYIAARLFDLNGLPVTDEFKVGDCNDRPEPDVAIDNDGDFVIVWDSSPAHIRLYNSDASPASDIINITGPLSFDADPKIAMAASGEFVVAWEVQPDGFENSDICAQKFDVDGVPFNGIFIVNTYQTGRQRIPDVAMNDSGDFVVTWDSDDGDGYGLFGQRFNNNCTPIGDEFQINTYIPAWQWRARVAMMDENRFVTVWQSDGQDGSGYGIFGEIGPKVCCADFSGDLQVNFKDFCVLAEEWLKDENPLKADVIDDNKVDFLDMHELGGQWLQPCYECDRVHMNRDGKIDFKDYAIFADNWQKQGPLLSGAGDITGNGIVDIEDLHPLVFYWLNYCPTIVWKPNIYLYPEQTMELQVGISFPHGGYVTESVPEYDNGWDVTVEPNGIIDGQYEYLFYESRQGDYGQYNTGWVVAQQNLESFFRANMTETGFIQKEIDDFIDYWLGRLTEHPFYALFPQYNEQLDEMIKLEFSTQPQNLIRLIYSIVGLEDNSLQIEAPEIPTFSRDGFTVAEWGVILK